MTTTILAMINGWEFVMIMAVVLVLFGPKKLPEIARSLGKGIREFKNASNEIKEDLYRAVEQSPVAPSRPSADHDAPATTVSVAAHPDLPASTIGTAPRVQPAVRTEAAPS